MEPQRPLLIGIMDLLQLARRRFRALNMTAVATPQLQAFITSESSASFGLAMN